MLPSRVTPPLLALALLSACGDTAGDEPQRKTAAGEVLGGSISDAMLPLDTVRSQSPSLLESAGADTQSGGDDEAEDTPTASPSPASSSSASAEPAASPSGDEADAED